MSDFSEQTFAEKLPKYSVVPTLSDILLFREKYLHNCIVRPDQM